MTSEYTQHIRVQNAIAPRVPSQVIVALLVEATVR